MEAKIIDQKTNIKFQALETKKTKLFLKTHAPKIIFFKDLFFFNHQNC